MRKSVNIIDLKEKLTLLLHNEVYDISTQSELANHTGIHASLINRWLNPTRVSTGDFSCLSRLYKDVIPVELWHKPIAEFAKELNLMRDLTQEVKQEVKEVSNILAGEPPKINDKKTYFSYAWGNIEKGETHEELVNQLYNSLKLEGHNVIRDKVNLGYRGLISEFMEKIGEGNLIVVVTSDKYFRSPYCMFELYEIARNSNVNKELFRLRILPIMVEFIDFSSPEILDSYFEHWEQKEQQWENLIKKRSNKLSPEQFHEYDRVKLIHQNFGNLVGWLIDMNTLNLKLLSQDNFAEIKKIIQESN